MTVATRPDPTVRPPSRYLNTVFLHIFYAFGWQNPHKTAVFTQCIFICLSSWHRFGTVGTSSSFTTINLNLFVFITRVFLKSQHKTCDSTNHTDECKREVAEVIQNSFIYFCTAYAKKYSKEYQYNTLQTIVIHNNVPPQIPIS